MYYIIYIIAYTLCVIAFITYIKRPDKKEMQKFGRVLVGAERKALKLDRQSRKKRVQALTAWDRFIYKLWVAVQLTMIIGMPVLFIGGKYLFVKHCVAPEGTLYFETGMWGMVAILISGFFVEIPLILGFSYLTYRGPIRRADKLYTVGSFQEYPKKANWFIAGICGLFGALIMFLPLNSYRYCTEDEITIKKVFALNEKVYAFSEIDHVEEKTYSGNNNKDYKFYTSDEDKFDFGDRINDDTMRDLLERKGITVIPDD